MIQGFGPKLPQTGQTKTVVNLSDLQQGLQMVAGYGLVDVSPDPKTGGIKVIANLDDAQLARAKEVIEQLAPFVFGNEPIPDFEFVSLSGAQLASAASSGSKLAFVDSFHSADRGSSADVAHRGALILSSSDRPSSALDAEKIGELGTTL